MRPVALARDLGLPLLAGAVLAGASQAVPILVPRPPPLHLLTHEFVQAFSGLAGVAWVFVAAAQARRSPPDAPARATTGGLLLGLGGWAVQAWASGHVHGCQAEDGSLAFWVTWAPVAVLASVAGALLHRRRHRAVAGWLALVVLGLLVHDLGQVLVGVRPTDPVLGAPRFLDQRADMLPDQVDLLQRGWLLLVALAAWLLARQPRSWASLSSGGALAAVTLLAASHVGLGWGSGALRARLDTVRETEHFVIRYAGTGDASLYVDRIAHEAEWQWTSVAADLGASDDVRVRLMVYDDWDQLERLTGIRSAHAWIHRVDLPWWDALDSTLRHELVHALHVDARPSPLVALNRAWLEGTAMAWGDGTAWDAAAHEEAAAMLLNGDLPAAADFLSLTGFDALHERTAYAAAGSFVGWLVLEHGAQRLWQVQRSFDFAAVYGQELGELDAAWRAFLRGVPVDLESRRQARRAFDRRRQKAYFDRRCPKVGPLAEEPESRAGRLAQRLDCPGAAAIYAELMATRPQADWAVEAGRMWIEAGEGEAALAQAEAGLALDGLGPDEVQDLLEVALAADLALGRTEAARAVLERMSAGGDAGEVALLASLLSDPEAAPLVARALATSDEGARRQAIDLLHRARPDDPGVRLLLARYGIDLPGGTWKLGLSAVDRQQFDLALDLAGSSPALCDTLSRELGAGGVTAVRLGELDLARRVASVFEGSCTRPYAGLAARRLRARIAWEEAGERAAPHGAP